MDFKDSEVTVESYCFFSVQTQCADLHTRSGCIQPLWESKQRLAE